MNEKKIKEIEEKEKTLLEAIAKTSQNIEHALLDLAYARIQIDEARGFFAKRKAKKKYEKIRFFYNVSCDKLQMIKTGIDKINEIREWWEKCRECNENGNIFSSEDRLKKRDTNFISALINKQNTQYINSVLYYLNN